MDNGGHGRGSLFTKARDRGNGNSVIAEGGDRERGRQGTWFAREDMACEVNRRSPGLIVSAGLAAGYRVALCFKVSPGPVPDMGCDDFGDNGGTGPSLIKGGNRRFHQRFFDASGNQGFAEEEAVGSASLTTDSVRESAMEKFCSALPCEKQCRICGLLSAFARGRPHQINMKYCDATA